MLVPCPFCGEGALAAPEPGARVRCPRCWVRLGPDDFRVPPRIFAGHTRSITAVALAPGGDTALSGSADHTLRLWDLTATPGTDPARATLDGHTDTVAAVAFTPDGQYALSGSDDHTLRLWDLSRGITQHIFVGHTRAVRAVAITPDGQQALSGGQDGLLIVWDLATGQIVRALPAHTQPVGAVAISPDGQRALSAGEDDQVRLWDLDGGHLLWTGAWSPEFPDPDAFSYANQWAVAFTADGQGALTGAETRLHTWDFSTDRPQQTIETFDTIYTVALSPSGRGALVGHAAGLVQVWNRGAAGMLHALRANLGGVFSLALSADGRCLIAGGADNFLRVWTLPADFLP